jgi:hypothetical protein
MKTLTVNNQESSIGEFAPMQLGNSAAASGNRASGGGTSSSHRCKSCRMHYRGDEAGELLGWRGSLCPECRKHWIRACKALYGNLPAAGQFFCRGCRKILSLATKAHYALSKNVCGSCYRQHYRDRKRERYAAMTPEERRARWTHEKRLAQRASQRATAGKSVP